MTDPLSTFAWAFIPLSSLSCLFVVLRALDRRRQDPS